MGRRKFYINLFIFFVLSAICSSCSLIASVYVGLFAQRGGKMVITSINLTESRMIIEVERGAANSFNGSMDIDYKNIPVRFGVMVWMDEKWQKGSLPTATLMVDLTNIPRAVFNEEAELKDENGKWKRILYINQEAVFSFSMQRAGLEAKVFIGEDRVDILEQRFFFINAF